MLTRNDQLLDRDSYYQNALNTTPTYKESVFDGFSMGATGGAIATNLFDDRYMATPKGQAQLSAFKATQLRADAPGQSLLQRGTGDLAYMVGSALDPITWIGGEAGAALTDVAGSAIAKYAPDAFSAMARTPLSKLIQHPVSKFIPETFNDEPLSSAMLSDKASKAFGVGVGVSVPSDITSNYNADTRHIDWGGVARSAGESGALGVAIGTIPFAYGILKGKLTAGNPEPVELTRAFLDKGLAEGKITPEEHQWLNDYLEAKKTPEDTAKLADIESRATKLVNDNGVNANTVTNEAAVHVIKPETMQSIQSALIDGGLSGLDEDTSKALAQFGVNSSFDELSKDTKTLDGVRGYLETTQEKLDAREEKTAEADETVDKYLTRGVNENMPFSQKELYKSMRKLGFETSHVDHLPMIVPDNLKKRMAVDAKITKLKSKMQKEYRKSGVKNVQTQRRIDELEASKAKIETPKEELEGIRKRLLGNGLPKNFERTKDYQRLMDLSNVWHNAKTLLDRVHLEDQYNRQAALHAYLSDLVKATEANLPQTARPEDVVNYLKKRIEGKLGLVENDAKLRADVETYSKVPTNADEILDENQRNLENSKATEIKEDFNKATEKTKEFKKKEGVFKSLISCILGASNG